MTIFNKIFGIQARMVPSRKILTFIVTLIIGLVPLTPYVLSANIFSVSTNQFVYSLTSFEGSAETPCGFRIVIDDEFQPDLLSTIIGEITKSRNLRLRILTSLNELNTSEPLSNDNAKRLYKQTRIFTKVQHAPHCTTILILLNASRLSGSWLELHYKLRLIGHGFLYSTIVHIITTSKFPSSLFPSARKYNAKFYVHEILNDSSVRSIKICTWCRDWQVPCNNPKECYGPPDQNLHLGEVSILDKESHSARMGHCLNLDPRVKYERDVASGGTGQGDCQIGHYITENMGLKYNFTPIYYPPSRYPIGEVSTTHSILGLGEVQKYMTTYDAERIRAIGEQSISYMYCTSRVKASYGTSSHLSVLLSPFEIDVWVAVLAAYGLCALALWGIAKATPNPKSESGDIWTQLFNSIGTLLGQNVNGSKFCFLTFCASLVALIILSFYSTILTSSLIVPSNPIIIHNLKDLVVNHGYKIQVYSPKSAGWTPPHLWFANVFSSYGILDHINASFNINTSDCFPPNISEELGLLTDDQLKISIGKESITDLTYYLGRLKASYPDYACYTVTEPTDRNLRHWRFLFHGNEIFSRYVYNFFVYGLVEYWENIYLHAVQVNSHKKSEEESSSDGTSGSEDEPQALTLSSKLGSAFTIWAWLIVASISVFLIELCWNWTKRMEHVELVKLL